MLEVEPWADISRMVRVDGLSQREVHRKTGIHRDTICKALQTDRPPDYGPRQRRPSKLDPYRAEIEHPLDDRYDLSGFASSRRFKRSATTGPRPSSRAYCAS